MGAENDSASEPSRVADLERRLRLVERTLAETERLAALGSWSWDVRADLVTWSDELYRLFGLGPRAFEATFTGYLETVHPEDRDTVLGQVESMLHGRQEGCEFDYRTVWPDGQVRWIRARARAVPDQDGDVGRLFGTAQDVTAAREAEHQTRKQRDELVVLAEVVQATDDSVIVASPDLTIQRWNKGAERIYGYTAEEAVGQPMSLILSDEMRSRLPDIGAELSARGHVRVDSVEVRKDGTPVLTSVTISQIRSADGVVTALVGIGRDVTEQKQLEERERAQARQLVKLAFHDPLTGLANRALLHDRLGHALARRRPHRTDVLLLDLDDFKGVNDLSGHAAGDRLLVEVGRRLLTCVRAQDTVARLGGDEFAILLEDAYGEADGRAVAERVQHALAVPISIGDRQVLPRASIGIGSNDDGTQDAEQLLLRADLAMYSAKSSGKGCVVTFSADMADAVRERADLEAGLRQAARRGEIVVHYQPIVDVKAGSVSRLEALVRWQRPQGLVGPGQFLGVAESTGIINEIGAEVLRRALSELDSWLRRDRRRSVAVNVSAVQLTDGGFASDVRAALDASAVDPGQLVLEVTESLFMEPEPQIVDQLTALQRDGIRVSIDDFGTGYSSLGRLHTLPVDSIKIDKSFVDDLKSGGEDLPILSSMILMAHNLGLDVTAEGVASPSQARRLVALGSDYLQGYHFARPVGVAAATTEADHAADELGLE